MVTVIEGGRADGTDLVMGDHHVNPMARMASNGTAPPKGMPLVGLGGDDALSAELKLVASVDADKAELVIVVSGLAGRVSSIAGFRAAPLNLGEFARIPVESVRAAIALSLDGPKEAEPAA